MIEAIKAALFNQAKYQTTPIINADDAVVGTGMFVKSSAEKGVGITWKRQRDYFAW